MLSVQETSEELLKVFELPELLEMNDIEEVDVLSLLIENGMIGQPERFLRMMENDEDE